MILTEQQIYDLSYPLVGIIKKYYSDPENMKGFQEWLRTKKQEEKSAESN